MAKLSTAQKRVNPKGERSNRYLFVGHNPPGHEYVLHELNNRGAEVTTVAEVSSAIDRLPQIEPHIVIYRAYFQRGTNLKLMVEPLALAAARIGSTLVVMSPRATEAEIRSLVDYGVSDFILIPCEPKLVIRRLDYQLSRRKLFETEELTEKTRELSSSLKLIFDAQRILATIKDPHKRLQEALKVLAAFTHSPRVNLFVGKSHRDKGFIVGSSDSSELKKYATTFSKYPEVREVLLKGMIVHVSDVSTNKLTQGLHQSVRSIKVDSIIVLPVLARGLILGTLHVRLLKNYAPLAQKHLNTFYTFALSLGATLEEIISRDAEIMSLFKKI